MTTAAMRAPGRPDEQDWEERAGAAWGHAADDWHLVVPSATEALNCAFEHLSVPLGVRLLDVECGTGLAMRRAATARRSSESS